MSIAELVSYFNTLYTCRGASFRFPYILYLLQSLFKISIHLIADLVSDFNTLYTGRKPFSEFNTPYICLWQNLFSISIHFMFVAELVSDFNTLYTCRRARLRFQYILCILQS